MGETVIVMGEATAEEGVGVKLGIVGGDDAEA